MLWGMDKCVKGKVYKFDYTPACNCCCFLENIKRKSMIKQMIVILKLGWVGGKISV